MGAVDLAHKGVVMRCLEAQCESGQLLVDLFVNYDCDLEGANLFERMVLALVRIAQGTQDKDASAPQAHDEEALRMGVSVPMPSLCASHPGFHTHILLPDHQGGSSCENTMYGTPKSVYSKACLYIEAKRSATAQGRKTYFQPREGKAFHSMVREVRLCA